MLVCARVLMCVCLDSLWLQEVFFRPCWVMRSDISTVTLLIRPVSCTSGQLTPPLFHLPLPPPLSYLPFLLPAICILSTPALTLFTITFFLFTLLFCSCLLLLLFRLSLGSPPFGDKWLCLQAENEFIVCGRCELFRVVLFMDILHQWMSSVKVPVPY